jgi:phosphoribosylglycinamide formyltransferase-1
VKKRYFSMNKAKVLVLVSGGGTNLQAIIDTIKAGKAPHVEICKVIASKPDAYALTRAADNGIPSQVIERKGFADAASFCKELKSAIDAEAPDLIVLAGFMCILTKEFTDAYPEKIINVHPSLIPSFCGEGFYGLRVHQAALDYGVKVSGATVHYVNSVVDGGKILAQKAVDVLEGDTPEILQERIMVQCERIILPETVERLCKEIINKK